MDFDVKLKVDVAFSDEGTMLVLDMKPCKKERKEEEKKEKGKRRRPDQTQREREKKRRRRRPV